MKRRPRKPDVAAPVKPSAVNPVAALFGLLATQQVARVREAEQARAAKLSLAQENVTGLRERMRAFCSSELGKKAAAVATPHERLLLAQLNTKIHRAWARGESALRAGRDAEAQPHLIEYDERLSDALWLWRLLVDHVRGADNVSISDH